MLHSSTDLAPEAVREKAQYRKRRNQDNQKDFATPGVPEGNGWLFWQGDVCLGGPLVELALFEFDIGRFAARVAHVTSVVVKYWHEHQLVLLPDVAHVQMDPFGRITDRRCKFGTRSNLKVRRVRQVGYLDDPVAPAARRAESDKEESGDDQDLRLWSHTNLRNRFFIYPPTKL